MNKIYCGTSQHQKNENLPLLILSRADEKVAPGPSYPGRNKIKEASKAIQEGILSKDTHPVNPRAYLQISFNTFHAFSPTIFSPVAFG